MSQGEIKNRRRRAPSESSSRARRAEVNAAYHVRRETRALVERLQRIANIRAIEPWSLVERLLRIIVEGGLARKVMLEIKKLESELSSHRKTDVFYNISNQLINMIDEKIHRKIEKKRA